MAIRNEDGATVIGRGAQVRGDLIANGDVMIEGAVEGSVEAAAGRVTVAREARVRAEVRGQEVVVMGRVEGNLHATERVELRDGAAVQGNVFAPRFCMEEQAALHGRVDPGGPAADTVPVAASHRGSEPAPAGAGRPSGQMPSALAAAARGALSTSAGLRALAVEPSASLDNTRP